MGTYEQICLSTSTFIGGPISPISFTSGLPALGVSLNAFLVNRWPIAYLCLLIQQSYLQNFLALFSTTHEQAFDQSYW